MRSSAAYTCLLSGSRLNEEHVTKAEGDGESRRVSVSVGLKANKEHVTKAEETVAMDTSVAMQ